MALFDGILGGGDPERRTQMASDLSGATFEVFMAAAMDLAGSDTNNYRSSLPNWQKQVFEFYDLVGEAWYPAQFYARMLSRVRLFVGRRKLNDEVEEIKITEFPEAHEILRRVRDPSGGQSLWKAQYGLLHFLVGDGNLVASLDDDGNERWEYLSVAEFVPGDKERGRKTYIRKMPGGEDRKLYAAEPKAQLTANTVRAWRLWNSHPLHSWMSDAPMRATIGQFRLLMLLDKAAEAQALSRIVGSGLLVVDDRITIPAMDSQAADDSVEDDPFMKLLTEYIVRPIGDPGSASAVAPLVARASIPEGVRIEDLIALIQLHDPNQTADWHMRIEKTIARIAIGLDMPPEEFLGLAQANHWTGWVITEEKWKAHGEPVTIRLCEDLTSAYFRPACLAAGISDDLIVWYDPAQVVVHPDRGKDAQAVHEAGELSGTALRRYNDVSEDAAPSEEERAFYRAMKLKTSERPKDPSEADASQTGADAPGDAPKNNGNRTQQPTPQSQNMSIIRGAAALMVERCREIAGSRLWSKRMNCEGCFNGAESLPKRQLAAEVGPEVVATLGFTADALVAGVTEPFVATAVMYGMDELAARNLAAQIERTAADTLYRQTTPFLSEDFSALA